MPRGQRISVPKAGSHSAHMRTGWGGVGRGSAAVATGSVCRAKEASATAATIMRRMRGKQFIPSVYQMAGRLQGHAGSRQNARMGESRRPAQRFQTGRVLTICGAHALHDTYTAFLPPLLPVFIASMGLTKTAAGFLAILLTAPSLVQPFIGHLADRVSLRYFVIVAPCVTAVMMSLLGVAPSYELLVLLLLVAGFSSACIHAVGPAMVGRLSGEKLGRGMGLWMVGGELGRTLGPIVIVTALKLLGQDDTPLLIVGGLLVSLALFIRLRDVPAHDTRAVAELPWRRMWSVLSPVMLPLAGVVLARAFVLSSLTTYLPVYLSEGGASLWFAGAALTILEAAGVAGALIGGSLSDWLGRRQVLFFSLAVTPPLMILFRGLEGWPRIPLLILMGFASLSVTPILMALVQDQFPRNRALANGVYMALSFCLRSAVIAVLGGLGDRFGMEATFLVSAAVGIAGLPLVGRLPASRPPVHEGPATDRAPRAGPN
ncbi:MAG: MFS transporter [Candidatus Eisenbacteria bacterium]|nr:MFS transporter [Candidatus Eisenbacteria bacterium]